MKRFSLFSALLSLAMISVQACGGGENPAEDSTEPYDIQWDSSLDIAGDPGSSDIGLDNVERDANSPDTGDSMSGDAMADYEEPPECPGGAGCSCETGRECLSGLCFPTLNGSVCSTYCSGADNNCQQGWVCTNIASGGDPIFACVYPFANLCKPCMTGADCVLKEGGGEKLYLCVEFGPEGSFCGAECKRDTDCPEGFQCEDIPFNGDFIKQCMPADDFCPCSAEFATMEYKTKCYNENEFGTCRGERTCATDCSAKVPTAEICNGSDDDCDDKIDEELAGVPCELKNSFGTCPGKKYCSGGILGDCQGTPAAPEICDGMDQDCNGVTDDNFPDDDKDGIANCIDPDIDGDGIANALDNCPYKKNPGQENNDIDDEDGPEVMGDACDPDDDNDGIPDVGDNCPLVKNSDQGNIDGDELGDACDCDKDGDGKANPAVLNMLGGQCTVSEDNCDAVHNPGQENTDADTRGDACDCDIDSDGIANNNPGCPVVTSDNCLYVQNPDQADTNANNKGDACDCDADSDGVSNNNPGCPVLENPDNCILVQNVNQRDVDKDKIGDACDCDIDSDTVFNNNPGCPLVDPGDNCPYTPNPDQNAMDCDDDFDGDGIVNEDDNCPWDPNPNQEDQDIDGTGDVCDCDADDDGIINTGADPNGVICVPAGLPDNCPLIANAGQDDLDTDGIGDACDCDIDGDDDPQAGFGCPTPAKPDCEPYNPEVGKYQAERCGNNIDDNCDGLTDSGTAIGCASFYMDNDRDTWGSADFRCLCAGEGKYTAVRTGDCDDNNPARHPGAQEICSNGLDDNCNGSENDENAANCLNFYYDNDADNYGTNDFKCLCSTSGLYSARFGGDCNDNSPAINPGIKEICFDGKDNDCTGSQNDVGAIGCTSYYYDGDNDGFGTSDNLCLCFALDMYRANQTGDCDDNDSSVKPGNREVCNNNKDDNCDGVQNTENADGCLNYFIDEDSDGYGATGSSKCLCAPTGQYTAAAGGDCKDKIFAINPGVEETCNNIDDNCSGATDENPTALCPSDDEILHSGMVCVNGSCQVSGCAAGWFDVNKSPTDGCECAQDANDNTANLCGQAIDLGTINDTGSSPTITRTGRIVPDTDADWYRIQATDTADSGTLSSPGADKFNLRAWVVRPSDGSIGLEIHVGSCSQPSACADGINDYNYNVSVIDKANTVGQGACINPTGQFWTCCAPDACGGGAGSDLNACCGANSICTGVSNPYNIRECGDDSRTFYIKVYRTGAPATSCAQTDYEVRFSNGK